MINHFPRRSGFRGRRTGGAGGSHSPKPFVGSPLVRRPPGERRGTAGVRTAREITGGPADPDGPP